MRSVLLLALFAALLYWIDLRQVVAVIVSISPAALAGALLLATADRILMGTKWRQLVLAGGGEMRVRDAVGIYYQTGLASHLLPTQVGSEMVRAYLGRRLGLAMPLLVASMVIEKLIAILASVVFAALGMIYLAGDLRPDVREALTAILVIGSLAGAAALIVALHRPTHQRIGRLLRKVLAPKLTHLLGRLSAAMVIYRGRRRALAVNLGVALVENGVTFSFLYVLGRELGVELPPLLFIAALAVVTLLRRLMAVLESWGTAEAVAVVLYTLLGFGKNVAVALALTSFAVTLLATLPGALLLFRNGLDFRAMTIRLPNASP